MEEKECSLLFVFEKTSMCSANILRNLSYVLITSRVEPCNLLLSGFFFAVPPKNSLELE